MRKTIIASAIAATAIAGTVSMASPAQATEAQFEQQAQQQMSYVVQQYGMAAVKKAGYDICRWESQGYTDTSGLANSTVHYLPMSTTAAIQLQVLAEFYLGC